MSDETTGATIDWQMRPRRPADVVLKEVPDGFVIHQPSRDRVHYLNPTAALILELCDGSLSAHDLPGFLAATFRLSAPPKAEVAACLIQLLAEGLLEVGGVQRGSTVIKS